MSSNTTSRPVFRPEKKAFVTYGFIQSFVAVLILYLFIFLALRIVPKVPHIFVWGGVLTLSTLFLVWRTVSLSVQFSKESYTLMDERIVAKGGGILTAYEKELLIKNITHVELVFPFIEYQFFQTGYLRIQAAGGDDVEIFMRSISASQEMYQQIMDRMQANGFSVACNQLVEEDKPEITGVWIGTIGQLFAALSMAAWMGSVLFTTLQSARKATAVNIGWEVVVLIVLIALALLLYLIYNHGRMMNQEYKMFTDAVESRTDFLTVRHILIPMENLSDSSIHQGLLARIFGFYHLLISCQGSGAEITFKYLEYAEQWKYSLDAQLQAMLELQKQQQAERELSGSDRPVLHKPVFKTDRDESFTASLKMDVRYLAASAAFWAGLGLGALLVGFVFQGNVGQLLSDPSAFFQGSSSERTLQHFLGLFFILSGVLFCFLAFLRTIMAVFLYTSYTFHIHPLSFESSFQFITQKKTIFNTDKVTGVIVHQGPIEKLLGVCSIEFWSVGAGDRLRFSHIQKDDELLARIKAKVNIHTQERIQTVPIRITLIDFLKARSFRLLTLTLIVATQTFTTPYIWYVWGVLLALTFAVEWLQVRFYSLSLSEDSLCFKRGILFKDTFWIHYEDVKYISSTRYPLTTTGRLTFDITGEHIIKTDKGEHKVSNRFHIDYVPQILGHYLAMDHLLSQTISLEQIDEVVTHHADEPPSIQHESKPQMAQTWLTLAVPVLLLNSIIIGAYVAMQSGWVFSASEWLTIQQSTVGRTILTWSTPILVLFDLCVLTFITAYVRSIRYILDDRKVCKEWGVFFKSKLGIHFVDIDYIGKDQNPINKLFSTENITVNTIGSSQTDLTLSAVEDARSFYNALQKAYRPHSS